MNSIIRYASPQYSQNLYSDYTRTGLLEDFLQLSSEGIRECQIYNSQQTFTKILYAPSIVARQTADILSRNMGIQKIEKQELKNIKHDFTKWLKPNELGDTKKMSLLRKNFLEDLAKDQLLEPRQTINSRIENVLRNLDGSTLLISHGLCMVAIELFINDVLLQKDSEIYKRVINTKKSFYGSLIGFNF